MQVYTLEAQKVPVFGDILCTWRPRRVIGFLPLPDCIISPDALLHPRVLTLVHMLVAKVLSAIIISLLIFMPPSL